MTAGENIHMNQGEAHAADIEKFIQKRDVYEGLSIRSS